MTKKTSKKPAAQAIYAQTFTANFSDCDPEQILFFAHYFKWAHDAIEGLTHHKKLWSTWFDSQSWGAPLRHVEADYFAPLAFGETAEAQIHVAHIGDTSITFETHFVANTKNITGKKSVPKLTAVVRTIHVFVDRKTFKPTQVPKEVHERLRTPRKI
ncbi:MAG: thioesterase family protein [Bdellovibrionota bacterium]